VVVLLARSTLALRKRTRGDEPARTFFNGGQVKRRTKRERGPEGGRDREELRRAGGVAHSP
jgi:hypothetical protein